MSEHQRRLSHMNKQFDCLPEEDRPYEKCIRYGVQALTNRELLAVILRTGARRAAESCAGEGRVYRDPAVEHDRAFSGSWNRKSESSTA